MTEQKRKAGRPSMNLVEHKVGLNKDHWKKAKKLGGGNKSQGLRVALDRFVEPKE